MTDHPEQLLSAKDLARILNMSKSTVWRIAKTADFPPKIRPSKQCVGWSASEIAAWQRTTQNTA